MRKRYYIEIREKESCGEYLFQSTWFNSKTKAINFAKKINFLDENLDMWLMFANWDTENGYYDDIEFCSDLRKAGIC